MRILITGGCGFIGSHITNELEKEHEVLIVDNLSSGKKEYINSKLEIIDIRDAKALLSVFEEFSPEIVIHTAAHIKVRESLEDPAMNAEHNILGTINVVEACKKMGVKRIIYTSTGGARYGNPKNLPVSEEHPANPLSPYGISKYSAEYYVKIAQEHGINSLIVCFGNVYGPRDEPESKHIIPIVIDKFLSDEAPTIFGDGEQTRDFLYVEDIVRVIKDNLTTTQGLFNLASGKKTSINKICQIIRDELKPSIKEIHTDAIAGEVRDIQLDISKAKTELSFIPTEITEGLKNTINWFQERKKK